MDRKEELVRYFDLDADGQTLVGVWNGAPWSMSAYDARTGALRNGLEGIPDSFHRLFPLEKGKVGFQFSASDMPPSIVFTGVGAFAVAGAAGRGAGAPDGAGLRVGVGDGAWDGVGAFIGVGTGAVLIAALAAAAAMVDAFFVFSVGSGTLIS